MSMLCSSPLPPHLYLDILIQRQAEIPYSEMPEQDHYEQAQILIRCKVQALAFAFFLLSSFDFFNFSSYKEVLSDEFIKFKTPLPLSAHMYLASALGSLILSGFMCLQPTCASKSFLVKITSVAFLALNASALGLALCGL